MIKIIKQTEQFKPDYGDLRPFNDNKYLFEIKDYDQKNRNLNNILWLGDGNVWTILMDMGIDISPLRQKYLCPHAGMEFFSLIPIYIMSDNVQKYSERAYSDMIMDTEWNWSQDFDEKNNEPYYGKIFKSMIGTGYQAFTSASDGSSGEKVLAVALDNGDILLCLTWIWYNK